MNKSEMDSPKNKSIVIENKKIDNNSSVLKVEKLSTGAPIEVIPEEIIFKDIQINQTYEITVFVRNLTKTARRIRVFQPHTSKFRADYDMQGAIAAGLAMKLVITFETSILEEFHDSIKIVSDGGASLEVPLHAYPPQAAIIFEPFINLGFVRVGREKAEEIYFKNEGKAAGKVELKFEKLPDLKIEPTSFTIQPSQEYAVKLNYKPKEAGIFRGLIEVLAEGNPIQKTIDINATSIEFTRFLIDENGSQTNQFDFGLTYYGQQKIIETYLVNNTPRQQKFKVKIKKGHHYQAEDISNLQTPNELGLEQTERIMDCLPPEGIIESYSQLPLKFKCQSKVSEKNLIWTRQYALNNEDLKADLDDYHYSAIFEFMTDQNDPLIVHLQAKCICPTVKFPPQNVIQFGTCPANLEKQILFQVTNKNKELPININFPTIPFFSVNPMSYILQSDSFAGFWINFKPKQTGSFQSTLNVELLNGVYKIPIKLCGTSTIFAEKQSIRRGPECVPEDFERAKKTLVRRYEETKKVAQSLEGSIGKLDSSIVISTNKSVYNEYLRTSRQQRLSKEKDKRVQQKFKQLKERLKELGFQNTESNKLLDNGGGGSDKEDLDGGQAPVDSEFEVGMMEQGLEEPKLNLPEGKDTLFVTKPIDKYEPFRAMKEVDGKMVRKFEPNPNQLVKKKFPHEPKTHSEIRDTNLELNSESLQKIQAGPVKIEFGAVYVKSRMTKTFYVRNDLRTAISVRLHTEREELQLSYLKAQIIPSGQIAGFDVVLCSKTLGSVKQNIKYIINEKHIFEFSVSGSIEPVQIDMSKLSMKFQFAEDNTDMETSENIKLTNNGNAAAKFKFLLTDKRIFYTTPEEGEVPSQSTIEVKVTYRPTQTQNLNSTNPQPTQQIMAALNRNEEEKLILKVTDGTDLQIRCFGIVYEPKCFIKQSSIEIKEIAVCKLETRPLTIKNQSRSSAVFQVLQDSLPQNVEITPMKGKIFPEDQKELSVKFQSKEEVSVKGEIVILIRGGRVLKLPFTGRTIIPEVQIVEEEFDFGNITTLGNSLPMKMTVQNNSTIPADLVLDLRGEEENPQAPEGIDCLEIKTSDDADESLLHSVHPDEEQQSPDPQDKKKKVDEEAELDAMADDQSEESEVVDLEVKQHKLFNLTLQPSKSISFTIKFCPKEVKQYAFNIPLTLARYGQLQSLTRQILCKGLKPKFLIEPQSIDFKKKVITTPDKCFPTVNEITLSNPDRREIHWKVDTSTLKNDKIFDVEPSEGVVASGQQDKIKIKFNPYGPGTFLQSVPLYIIDDPEISASLPYAELSFTGAGAYPRLLFDKKEVIMPVVPLNIVSKCTFRIINDGYENLNLQYKWGQEIGNFQVEVRFPEGKNLGITKNKLKVEVVFHHKKPLSFTTRLEFIDEARVYSINISGTTDNCLLTNYVYLQRMIGEFKVIYEEKKPITLIEDDGDLDSMSDVKSRAFDKVSKKSKRTIAASVRSGSSKSQSALGYTPLKQEQLDESCDYIARWLNYHVLQQSINSFPDSVVEHNGLEMMELVTFLTGKTNLPYKVTIEQNQKRLDRCQLLFKQYDEMIRTLKIEGALLNHIRPEYLLSYPDYLAWLKTQPKEKYEYVPENLLRLNIAKYTYSYKL